MLHQMIFLTDIRNCFALIINPLHSIANVKYNIMTSMRFITTLRITTPYFTWTSSAPVHLLEKIHHKIFRRTTTKERG